MNFVIATLYAVLSVLTSILAYLAELPYWHLSAISFLPLAIYLVPGIKLVSGAIIGRAFLPIMAGAFFVILFHYFPNLVDSSDYQDLRRYGIGNEESSLFAQSQVEVSNTFVNSITVLYAITVAFLLLKGLNDFDELKAVLHEEANELGAIADYSLFFLQNDDDVENRSTIARITDLMQRYINNFAYQAKITVSAENEDIIRDCIFEVGRLRPVDHNDTVALAEIMKSVRNLSVVRSKRIVCIEKTMSPYLLGIIFLMSIAMVLSFFASATGSFSIEYFYVFLLPLFYTAIFMTLLDLSSPFDGYWSVKLMAIESVKEKFENMRHDNNLTHPSSTPK